MAGYNPLGRLIVVFLSGAILSSFLSITQDNPLEESVKRGEGIFINNCIACHLIDGKGIPSVFPPLAGSDYLLNNKEKSIQAVLYGLTGEITVNGEVYFGQMVPIKLTDQEVADVLNYARNSWGNEADEIKVEEVKALRKQ